MTNAYPTSKGASEGGDGQAIFEQCGLSALCADICSEWGVESRADLALVTTQDVDELPKYIRDKLKPVQKRKLLALVGGAQPELQPVQAHAAADSTSAFTNANTNKPGMLPWHAWHVAGLVVCSA